MKSEYEDLPELFGVDLTDIYAFSGIVNAKLVMTDLVFAGTSGLTAKLTVDGRNEFRLNPLDTFKSLCLLLNAMRCYSRDERFEGLDSLDVRSFNISCRGDIESPLLIPISISNRRSSSPPDSDAAFIVYSFEVGERNQMGEIQIFEYSH